MVTKISRHARAGIFRTRLMQAMAEKSVSQSALARGIQVDRSTISQVLKPGTTRLASAQLVAESAALLGVSADWLLGLTERPELVADLLATSLSLTKAPRALVDDQIFTWHQEAIGYKIRHVPAGLPDMLKTQAMLEWEYAPHLGRTTKQAVGASVDRLDFMRAKNSDYEIAIPLHEITSFARGEGYYKGLPGPIRREQIAHFRTLYGQLYPSLRVYLFDARKLFSSPITLFGPLLAVLYLGRNYVAFRDTERVTAFREHFDALVREASVPAREFPHFLDSLGR